MRSIFVVAVAFVSFVLLSTLSSLTYFQVEVAQPNGLAYIYFPYGLVSLVAQMGAFWFLIFGVIVSVVLLFRGTADRGGRPILGSGLVSTGIYSVLFALLWSLISLEEEGGRCIGGCDPSLLQYYQTVYVVSALLVILGVAAAIYGGLIIARKKTDVPTPYAPHLSGVR